MVVENIMMPWAFTTKSAMKTLWSTKPLLMALKKALTQALKPLKVCLNNPV